MIEFIPDWIEWIFIFTGIIAWLGLTGAVLIYICEFWD